MVQDMWDAFLLEATLGSLEFMLENTLAMESMVDSILDSWEQLVQHVAIHAPIGEWVRKFDSLSDDAITEVCGVEFLNFEFN